MIKLNVRIILEGADEEAFISLKGKLLDAPDSEIVRYSIRAADKEKPKSNPTFDRFGRVPEERVSQEEMNRRYQTGDYPKETLLDGGDVTYEEV